MCSPGCHRTQPGLLVSIPGPVWPGLHNVRSNYTLGHRWWSQCPRLWHTGAMRHTARFPCPNLCVLLSYRPHYPLHRECDCSGRPLPHVLNSRFVSEKFCFFTAERSERVQKTYFSLTNIFVHLLLFCATPLNLPSWSLFFLVVVEVARPPTLVSWESSAVLLDNLCLCVWLMIMTYTGYYIPFLAISILGSDWQRGRN